MLAGWVCVCEFLGFVLGFWRAERWQVLAVAQQDLLQPFLVLHTLHAAERG